MHKQTDKETKGQADRQIDRYYLEAATIDRGPGLAIWKGVGAVHCD